ncbi:MAG TPA: serine/threonine-protein kinase [Polyangiaceae bacterium]
MQTPSAKSNTGLSGSQRRAKRDQQQSVELAEHLGDLRRFKAGLLVALPTWLVFSVLDWIAVRWGGAPSLAWMWTMRFGFLPIAAWTLWCAFKNPPISAPMLRVVDVVCYGSAAVAIALMAVPYGAIASPYLPGIMMVIIARGAFSAQSWKRALLPNLVMASSFPVVMAIAALVEPSVAQEMERFESRSTATHDLFFIYGTMVMTLAGTHYAWTLRRQLFESRSIGRYRLKERIGSGGMGEVWAAYRAGLKRDVALKMLKADAARDETIVARFEREVKATSELSHPNTIRVFDFGVTDDGIFYYAMELLDGETLADLVKRSGPLPCERAAHLVLQAARSLAEAHQNGIVHRDVKPANLFVTRAGGEPDFVKVLDFGIAKQDDADVALTTTGEIAGTPKYMAPEVVLGAPATPRADVYGLGAVLYLTLAGRAPFEGENASAIYVAHITEAPPLPSTIRGEPVSCRSKRSSSAVSRKSRANDSPTRASSPTRSPISI